MTRITILLLFMAVAACKTDRDDTSSGQSARDEFLSEYESDPEKWGFLDRQGEVAIKAKYDQVSAFSSGLAAVNFKGAWGYVNTRGEVVIPYLFLAAWPHSEGLARVLEFEGREYFIDTRGRALSLPPNLEHVYDFHDGRARVETFGKFGFIDTTGAMIIEPLFDFATDFSHGMARVRIDGKEGLISLSGDFLLQTAYDRTYVSHGSPYLVQAGPDHFFLDEAGQRLSEINYISAKPFENSSTAVRTKQGWFLIARDETSLHKSPFDDLRSLGGDRWAARTASGYILTDASGTALNSVAYQQINKFHEGVAVYRRDNLCGFMNMEGIEILPPQYGLAWDFSEGLARAAFRDGIAYIDKSGRIPFIPRYQEIRDFSEGLAPFQEL